jgi:large subunit ribosomal protein L9
MQVILTQHVAKLGKKFDVVDVADGYAANYLFPQGLAERATDARIAELSAKRDAARAAEDARHASVLEKLETLKETSITIIGKADDAGHLYKKIHVADIAAVLADEYDVAIEKDAIELDATIAATGAYTVVLVVGEKKVSLPVTVAAEE